jgi:hypothetical protein
VSSFHFQQVGIHSISTFDSYSQKPIYQNVCCCVKGKECPNSFSLSHLILEFNPALLAIMKTVIIRVWFRNLSESEGTWDERSQLVCYYDASAYKREGW